MNYINDLDKWLINCMHKKVTIVLFTCPTINSHLLGLMKHMVMGSTKLSGFVPLASHPSSIPPYRFQSKTRKIGVFILVMVVRKHAHFTRGDLDAQEKTHGLCSLEYPQVIQSKIERKFCSRTLHCSKLV